MSLDLLRQYLDRLEAPREFWWRDDDTGSNLNQLNRLLELRSRVEVPLVISAVPALLTPECQKLLACDLEIFVAQHGFDHSDHAISGEKSIELGGHAAPDWIIERIRQGQKCLKSGNPDNLLALMVPPWNRVSDKVLAALPTLGFQSISTFAKDRRGISHQLAHINCHIDPILWREGKRQMTETELATVTIEQLRAGRERPTGLLTHHLDMDKAAYGILEDFLTLISSHPMIHCPSPTSLFGRF